MSDKTAETKEPKVCEPCGGFGKIDSLEKKPWNRRDRAHHNRIISGKVMPEVCEGCDGTGYELNAEQKKIRDEARKAI